MKNDEKFQQKAFAISNVLGKVIKGGTAVALLAFVCGIGLNLVCDIKERRALKARVNRNNNLNK